MKILEVRPEQVICLDNGVVTTRPNSPYYSLKYFNYDSRRIAYTFSDKSFIQETFDARIFNCWCDGKRIQLRQDLSEKLAAAINHHMMYGNIREYQELFNEAYVEEPDWYMLGNYLRNIEGVVRTKEGFIIYDEFKIDYKGNAWVRNDGEILTTDDRWYSLCIVMQGSKHSYKAESAFLPNEYGNMEEVNSLTMTIISKIMFLLNPNLEDMAFTGQLSKSLLMKLSLLRGGVQ